MITILENDLFDDEANGEGAPFLSPQVGHAMHRSMKAARILCYTIGLWLAITLVETARTRSIATAAMLLLLCIPVIYSAARLYQASSRIQLSLQNKDANKFELGLSNLSSSFRFLSIAAMLTITGVLLAIAMITVKSIQ